MIMLIFAGLLLFAAMLGGCHPDHPIPQPVMMPVASPEQPVSLPASGSR